MKKLVLSLAILSLLALGGQAGAVMGTADNVPAATLLLPYFEVDLDDLNGSDTLFSINNASAGAVIAHVNVYTDASVNVLDFDVYLTGYDVVTVRMRDILNGILPRTADLQNDPGDAISNRGQFSEDASFPSCVLPLPNLPASFVTHLRNSLTGQATSFFNNQCVGIDHGDNVARGYITIDVTSDCSILIPGSPGYFAPGGAGLATNDNVLWGDYFYVNASQNFAQGETLVAIEASATDASFNGPGDYTFYGRYVGWSGADNRESLPTNFGIRYLNGGAFDGGTDLLVWRDAKVLAGAFSCAVGTPPWAPLSQEQIVIFDEEENPEVPSTIPVSPQPPGEALLPFPYETNRTAVDGPDFPISFDFGWIFLNLNTTVTGQVAGLTDPAAAQAWVSAVMDAEGRFSVGFDAMYFDNASVANHVPLPNIPYPFPINVDCLLP